MLKVLLVYPSKWGRGITPIWVASHTASLRSIGCDVRLFSTSFYKSWAKNEVYFNTSNHQYKESDYERTIEYSEEDPIDEIKSLINFFKPQIIFSSAISSHIHGEGEYVNIEYFEELISQVKVDKNKCKIIAGGLQVTASVEEAFKKFKSIDLFIRGESELVIKEIAECLANNESFYDLKGISYKLDNKIISNSSQNIIKSLDVIGKYDYSLFNEKDLIRPYNGLLYRGVDYELSRGCIYSCSYCVETVIQRYYGFNEYSKGGVIKNFKNYIRSKTALRISEELKDFSKNQIKYIRCQDTNFLTINPKVLSELATILQELKLDIFLYIETRPDGINKNSVKLLKALNVDGVGMGIELSNEDFREKNLNRYSSVHQIINAFKLLKDNGIKRTSYNVIGFPDETEEMIVNTIKLNTELQPDNITVAFYSPYEGTAQGKIGIDKRLFRKGQKNVDGQLRSLSISSKIDLELLNFYKRYFTLLVRNGLQYLEQYKKEYFSEK